MTLLALTVLKTLQIIFSPVIIIIIYFVLLKNNIYVLPLIFSAIPLQYEYHEYIISYNISFFICSCEQDVAPW